MRFQTGWCGLVAAAQNASQLGNLMWCKTKAILREPANSFAPALLAEFDVTTLLKIVAQDDKQLLAVVVTGNCAKNSLGK